MKTRPDLIALDLDGTLLDDARRLGERAATALRELVRRGTHVVLATGRPLRLTTQYVETLGLEYALVFNGASTYRASTGICTHHHQLDRNASLDVVRQLRARWPDVRLGLETHHGWYLEPWLEARRRSNPFLAALPPPDGVGPVEDFVRDAVIKVFARHELHDARSLAAGLDGLDVYATWTQPALLEVMHPAVNKRDALARLACELGIAREAVAAFGDAHNDVQVLAWAGHGVAVANATEEARGAADEITASNEDEGVARVLERWL